MKRQVLLSVLAAIAIFAVTTNANAGMFGRMSLLHGNCCAPACEACEPAACQPCEPACEPCDTACNPCDAGCYDPCCRKPFRPFGGYFANLHARMKAKSCFSACNPCEPACEPCEVACQPCEPICDPCEASCCDPCGSRPFRPFGGYFANLHARWKAKACCSPCEPACEPCEPACDPCHPCK